MALAMLLIMVSILVLLLVTALVIFFQLDKVRTENFDLWTELIDQLSTIEALMPEKTEAHDVGDIHNL